ncbi:MAG: rod-binding protein [Lachnospiraceae bacterium]|nr:rod-binding protein [Lachnospiraceae bacterium]
MDITKLNSDYLSILQKNSSDTKAQSLSNKLSGLNENSSDEELMEACESFESYLIEQVIKSSKSAFLENKDEDGEYMKYFADTMNQSYAKLIAEHGNLGIAEKLYDSIKRNS